MNGFSLHSWEAAVQSYVSVIIAVTNLSPIFFYKLFILVNSHHMHYDVHGIKKLPVNVQKVS